MSSLGDAKETLTAKKSYSELSIEERIELLQQARHYAHHAKAATSLVSPNRALESSSNPLEPNLIRPCTSSIGSRTDHLESNVERWIADADDYEDAQRTVALQPARLSEYSGTLASFWYMLALLPVVSFQRHGWCSPRNSIVIILNAVDSFAAWLKRIVSRLLSKIFPLDIDQVLYQFFLIVIDVVLGLHALVILLVSFYQEQSL